MANVAVARYREEDNFIRRFRRKERVKNTIGTHPFDSSQTRKAIKLGLKFMEVAKQNPNNVIDKVTEVINESKGTDPEVVRWALMFFISNHPGLARWALLVHVSNHLAAHQNERIPSSVNRAPEVSVPEKQPFTAPDPGKPAASPAHHEDVETLTDKDPNFNERHDVVHSPSEVPDDPRHEKLFIDMHQQMLARFDLEHQALGLPPLESLRKPDDYGSRAPNQKLRDANEILDGTKLAPDLLGSAIESFGLNDDHVMLACMRDQGLFDKSKLPPLEEKPKRQPSVETDPPQQEADNDPGLMHNPHVSERDRKRHRHVDDLHDKCNKWQETPSPHDFSDAPPPVNNREGDLILDKLTQQDDPHNPRAAVRDRKQYRHVDDCHNKWQETPSPHDFSNTPPPVNIQGDDEIGDILWDKEMGMNSFHITTKMKHKKWTLIEGSGATVDIEHLFQRKYYYDFRVENTSPSQLDATFRVFLAPEELANSRRHWIEIDNFKQTLPSKSKTVFCRDCDMSSVRQLLQKTEELDDTGTEGYMERGRIHEASQDPEARKFKLLVLITNCSKEDNHSFFGGENSYSDPGPTDYHFDKPFKNSPYEEKGNWTTEDREIDEFIRETQLAANDCTNKSLCK